MLKNNIYISTSFFKNQKISKTINFFKKNNFYNLELSTSIYEKNIFSKLNKFSQFKFIFHNYFAPPSKDFVLNLASSNRNIIKKSINHIKKNIRYSKKFQSKFCSFHAGFRFDPSLLELGKRFSKIDLEPKKKSIKIFLKSILILSKYAKKNNVNLLIENNILTKKNMKIFGENPFLLVDPVEIKKIFKKVPNNVKLLLDTGHFKVSSKTIGFNLLKSHKNIIDHIGGYHLNENNGLEDQNLAFNMSSWFAKCLKKKLDYYSIEVKNTNISIFHKMIKLIQKVISHENY